MPKFHHPIIAITVLVLAGCAAGPASQSPSTEGQTSELNRALSEQAQELETKLGSVRAQLAATRESAADEAAAGSRRCGKSLRPYALRQRMRFFGI